MLLYLKLEEHMVKRSFKMSLAGTQTEKNILTAFAGESQARNRYNFYASKATKDGYVLISYVFTETAEQEKEHASRLFKFIDRTEAAEIEITAEYPVGIFDTVTNLMNSAAGENFEHEIMYPNYAKVAREEGFDEIAIAMENIAVAEAYHEKRFKKLACLIESGKMFEKDEPILWRCRNCGWVGSLKSAPDFCPACKHEKRYFEALLENLFI